MSGYPQVKGKTTSPQTHCSVRHLPSNDYSQNSDVRELCDCLYQHKTWFSVWGLWLLVGQPASGNEGVMIVTLNCSEEEGKKLIWEAAGLSMDYPITHKHAWVPTLKCVHMKRILLPAYLAVQWIGSSKRGLEEFRAHWSRMFTKQT